MRRSRIAWPALALSTLLAGCASLSEPLPNSSQADIEALKARVIELQRKAAAAEVEIARLRQEVLELRHTSTPTASPANVPPAASTPVYVPPVPPPGKIEEDDLEPAPGAPEGAPSETAAPTPETPPAPTGEPGFGVPPPLPVDPGPSMPMTPEAQAVYDQAYTLYHQGRYLDAETAFQRFLQAYGRTDLGDNASYWIGECRYARGDLRGALAAFRETIERYPQGNKVPDALLKSGQCFEGVGDNESARAAYDELLERFGDSAAAAVARARRDRLP